MDTALSALIKPVVDALIAALKAARGRQLKRTAAKELSAAVRELLTANPNEHYAEAKIAAARAAGLLSEDLFLAEKLLKANRKAAKRDAEGGAARKKTSRAKAQPQKPDRASPALKKKAPAPARKAARKTSRPKST